MINFNGDKYYIRQQVFWVTNYLKWIKRGNLTAFLFILMTTLGCQSEPQFQNPNSTISQTKSEVKEETNIFNSVSFPQNSCGDKLPNDSKDDAVKFYPVFIDYSENNLQSIKTNYCKDAIKKTRKDNQKESVQVASFISEERANQFKNLLDKKIGNAEVGEPHIIAITQTSQSTEVVAKAARLTPKHVEKLKNISAKSAVGIGVIIPTYLPPGFQPYIFKHEDGLNGLNLGYTIIYKNANNACFSLSTEVRPYASPDGLDNAKEVYSTALGKVNINYTSFNKGSNNSQILAFLRTLNSNGQRTTSQYSISSPAGSTEEKFKSCTTVSLAEAVKIVESLKYLFSDDSNKIEFANEI
ncbi:hypothetical protein CAL7716_105700 (plasmid) [Calothrix sp. PCC 7716]|nr:hypothetical protein CAL7716_105700 [Calothrix sp. PCC 7716]